MDTAKLDAALLAEIESHAIKIARQAGEIVLEQFQKPLEVQFKSKKSRDPVTTADNLSDEYLKKAIAEKFPSHGILSEEGTPPNGESAFVWVLDPVDGTVNFMNGLPLFAVSVGVLWKQQPVAGAIFVPVSHRASAGVYHASLGKGAFLNSERIEVNKTPSGRPLTQIGGRFSLTGQSRKEPHEGRNLGSMALEIALTAAGIFRYSLFGRPKLWDVAAGVLLVKEAGGLAFTTGPRAKTWQVLERFQLEQNGDAEPLEKLRDWSSPVLVGPAETLPTLVKDIRTRHRSLAELGGRFWSRIRGT